MWHTWGKQIFIILIISVVAGFFMKGLVKPGLPTFHDSNPHVSRMIAFHTALHDGQFPPMWAKEMLGGIGSPVMMLNYQLPYFVSEGFFRAGLTYFDSYKLTLAISFILSGIAMYLALKSKQFSDGASLAGALIYTLAPYRFVDIYVRGALGESLTFIFPPLLLWGFTRSSLPILIIGWTGLFLTHPLASATFSAFYLGYVLFVGGKQEIAKRLQLFWSSFGVALLIAMFNLLPTLALTKYTYYSPLLSGALTMFPTLIQLFHSVWGYGVSLPGPVDGMSFELGIVQWIAVLSGIIALFKTKSVTLRYLIGSFLVCLFFVMAISAPIYTLLNLTSIIDFPWRLLFCLVFASAWIGAEVIDSLKVKKSIKLLLVILVILGLVAQSLPIAHTNTYWHKMPAWFARETGDSYGEYAPLTRSTRDSAPFWLRAEAIEGSQAQVTLELDKSNHQTYKVVAQHPSIVRVNTSYFPGWVIKVDNQIVPIGDTCYITKRTQIDIDDSGLMACRIGEGEHRLEIEYHATTVQRLGDMLTLTGIGVYLWILFRSFYQPTMKVKRSSRT